MRHFRPWPFLSLIFALLPNTGSAQLTERFPSEWLHPCQVPDSGEAGWCGTVEVPEDWEHPDKASIGLAVLVLPARARDQEEDPVVWLHGGPGAAATRIAGAVDQLLWRLRERRDLVFVDQRGTGASSPLTCPEDDSVQGVFGDFLDPEAVRRCLRYVNRDVRLYTTDAATRDLEAVRRVLRYPRMNLVGVSYGSRAALAYLKAYPERVRALVLKGVVSPDMKAPLPFGGALERALDGLFAACAVDRWCNERYPDLVGKWEQAIARFDDGAVTAYVHDPVVGGKQAVSISKGVFVEAIRHVLYSVDDARILPSVIAAAAKGKFEPFAALEVKRARDRLGEISLGVFLTISCSEDVRFIDSDEVAAARKNGPLGAYRVRRQVDACRLWPQAGAPAYRASGRLPDVPTLLLSGVYDAATPPEYADRVAEDLPNALHVVFPNASHDFSNEGCQIGLITRFIQDASTKHLDLVCVGRTSRPPFADYEPR